MSDPLEQKYSRFNMILSVLIGAMLAVVGGLWLYQNKDFKFSSVSPVKWVVDKAIKNGEDFSLPKSEPIKGLQFDSEAFRKSLNAGVLSAEQIKDIEKKYGKFNQGATSYRPPSINIPSYQPPRPYVPPSGPRR